jgi:RNA polymerase sigma-70 factor (ECF subfamily)
MPDFTEVYDEHLWRIYGYIAYRVASRADAEDLTQQTFERALGHWSEFDSRRGAMTTWLVAIARNLIIDHHRSRATHPSPVALHELSEPELPHAPPLEADLGLDPELAAALAELSDRDRELVGLRYGADLSGPEIAELTGLTLANVQQILSRSLRRMRARLEGGRGESGAANAAAIDAPSEGHAAELGRAASRER